MLRKAAKVEGCAPRAGHLGSISGPVKGKAPAGLFESGQKQSKAVRDGDRVGSGRTPLWLGECNRVRGHVDQPHVQAGFPQPAPGSVCNFKADPLPFLGWVHLGFVGKEPSDAVDLLVGKDRPLSGRILFASVVQHLDRCHKPQEPALPMNPFKGLDIVHRKVAADRLAVGSWDAYPPSDVLIRMQGGKILKGKAVVVQKPRKMSPRVNVMTAGGRPDRVALDHAQHPAVVGFDRPLSLGELRGQLLSLGSVERVVLAESGCLSGPLSVRCFYADPIPRTVFSSVNCSHVTSVSNHLKT